jgi:hypothetical protein
VPIAHSDTIPWSRAGFVNMQRISSAFWATLLLLLGTVSADLA